MGTFYEQLRLPKVFVLVLSLFLFGQLQAQDRTVRGKVTSAEDGSPIPGVSIIVLGTTTGTITDMDGNYNLNVSSGASLSFSSVGFISQSIDVGAQSVIDVILNPDITQLSEVVVIGYGTREKKDLTGAIGMMNAEEISQSNAMTPELTMQGRMAGVYVSSPSGNPQDRPNIQIRGIGTFNATEPLYVIDGMPITEYGSGWEGVGTSGRAARVRDLRGEVNVLTMINPQDIESITVLKDASAAAIYGVRAANGVILITTKKGKQGRPKVDIDLKAGVRNIPNTYELLGVPDYVALYQEAHFNNPGQLANMPLVFNPSDTVARPSPYDAYLGTKPTTDWQNPMLNKNAALYDFSAKVYGGNENTNYFVGGGYAYTEGPLINNFLERYSFTMNISSKVGKFIEVGGLYRGAFVESQDQSPSLTNAVSAPPWQPIYYEDDFYGDLTPQGQKYGYATTIDTFLTANPSHPQWGGTGDPQTTPIYNMDVKTKYGVETEGNTFASNTINNSKSNYMRHLANAYLAIKPVKGLMLKATYNVDWFYQRRNSWNGIDAVMYAITPGNPWDEGNRTGTTKGSYGERHLTNYNLTAEFLANYNHSFGDHNLDITVNFMDQRYGFEGIAGGGDQIDVDDPDRRGIPDSDPLTNNVFTDRDRFALQGIMGRVSYNYASKYYFDATVRRDGSSRFAPGYQWGTFPSFALAWRISGENFMSGVNLINDLKLRAGWGQLGNQETKPFAYLSTVGIEPGYSYGSGPGNGAGQSVYGIRLPDFPTEDLSWETTTTFNVGVDALLLNNRLNVTVEFFDKVTADILQSAGIAPTVGNEYDPILNIAKVRNRGFEFQVGWNGSIGPVDYFVNGNFTLVDNEVLDVWRDQPFYTRVGGGGSINEGQDLRIEKGYPLFHLWGFQAGGIFQSQEEVDQYQQEIEDNQGNPALVSAGDFYFLDVHGAPTEDEPFYSKTPDGIVDLNDRTFLGSTIPGHYYGFTVGLSWMGIDVSAFFQGIGDVYAYNSELAKGVSMSSTGINQWVNVLNRWTPNNKNTWDPDDKANSLPRAVRNDPAANNRYSDRFVEKAGFMRLRNLTVGYSLPQKLISASGFIERFRVYVSGTNLFTITQWSGPDPENQNVPIPVEWSVGLNATF